MVQESYFHIFLFLCLCLQEFPVSVDTLFEFLFTESDFYKRVQKERRTKGVYR